MKKRAIRKLKKAGTVAKPGEKPEKVMKSEELKFLVFGGFRIEGYSAFERRRGF
ncbi:MAG: hypothetical protein ACPLW8_04445 [Candidatus Bathyarchaeales archaeon]